MTPEDVFIIDNGCYGVGEDARDFIFGEDISAIQLAPIQNTTEYYYNQATLLGGKLRSFCTVVSPIQILSSIFDYKLTTADWEDLWKFAQEKYGYREGVGHYIQTGVRCAVAWWNSKFPDKQALFFRIPELLSADVLSIWSKGYSVASGYQGDTAYNRDRDDNGRVDGIRFGRTYGHAVPVKTKEVEQDSKKLLSPLVSDSYEGRPTNVYELGDLNALRDNNVFFPTAYIIVPDPKNEIKKAILEKKNALNGSIKEIMYRNSEMRHSIAGYPDITSTQLNGIRKCLNDTNNAFRALMK